MIYFLIATLSIHSVFANDDFSKETVKSTALTQSLYMIEGAGGNITASIGADGVLLVDDGYEQMAEKLLAKLKELKGASPRYIVNTHFHYDHTGGNEVFASTATVIATSEVRDRLSTEQTLWHKPHPPVPSKALPTLTFKDSITFYLNGDAVRIVHFPNGHTDGDSVVFFEKGKVVSMGDLYFSGMFPIFHPEHEGSLDGLLHNIGAILKETPNGAKIIPGHGPLSDKKSLKLYSEMIFASISTVKIGIKNGLTLEQIQKTGLEKKWEPFSHGYRTTNQWLESIYQSIRKRNEP